MTTWGNRLDQLAPSDVEGHAAVQLVIERRRDVLDELERQWANEPRNPDVPAIRPRSLPRPQRTETEAPSRSVARRLRHTGRVVTVDEVARLLDEAPRSRAELCTLLGGNSESVSAALRTLIEQKRAAQHGQTKGARYTAWQEPGDESDGSAA